MTRYVWLSKILSDSTIGQNQGLHVKRFGAAWDPATEAPIPVTDEQVKKALEYLAGHSFQRHEMVECAAVFNENNFKRIKDIFAVGGFYAVRGRLAEILAQFDLAPGCLYPLPVYKADKLTPIDEPFFLLNFGAQKQCFLPERSVKEAYKARYIDKNTGAQVWKIQSSVKDDDLVLSDVASSGADLWFDPCVENKLFLSDALVSALRAANINADFQLIRCRVLESEG